MSEVSKKREEQEQEISELETQIMQIQEKHFEEIQSLKSHFLLEKVGFQEEANERVKGLQKKSQAEAIGYLTSHSRIVKADNIKLRRTLLALIEYNKQQQGATPHPPSFESSISASGGAIVHVYLHVLP